MDCISSLPDEILYLILSLLSTKEAASTSVLAKRWRNVFAFSPNLCFEENDFVYQTSDFDVPCSFRDFLDRVLAVSGNSPLNKFSLKYRRYVVSDHTNRWICNVLSRGVLERLHLDVMSKGLTSLPTLEIFTCKTLVELKLGRGFVIDMVPENACLPSLKTLFLEKIRISCRHGCPFESLLSACPVLEEFVMRNVESVYWQNLSVSCTTLQRLAMNCLSLSLRPFGWYDSPSMGYSKTVQNTYTIVNLDSLVEAELDHSSSVASLDHSNLENLIKGLRDVHILNLSTLKTMEAIYTFSKAIPKFKNLFHLSIKSTSNDCCPTLPLLLKNCPNLKTLVIKGPLHSDKYGNGPESVCMCLAGYSCLLSCRVRVLEIDSYGETNLELGQLKHFLKKLSYLELVKVRSWATDEQEKLGLTKDLLNLPRSSQCEIQLEFIAAS